MNKFLIIAGVLLIIGAISFGIAFFCFHEIQSLKETYEYYGIRESIYMSDEETASIFFNFKFGIIKFSIFGIISWILAGVLFYKRKKIENITQ